MTAKRIFALDYGRGTMAGFYCDPLHVELFQPIMDVDGEPSGFALMKDGSYRLGKELYIMDGNDSKECDQLLLNVKALPDGNDPLQIKYAKAWRQKIENDHPDLFRDCEEIWLIGCPTAKEWRHKKVVESYKRIFEEAGYKNVIIVPESNAALMCLQQQFNLLSNADKDVGVLCIDLGAYSSDSTYVVPGKVQSFGGYIGASLLERMILAKNLAGVLCKRQKNSPEVIAAVARKCGEDSSFANYLLTYAKSLKEGYFTAKVRGGKYTQKDFTTAVDICIGDEKIDALGADEFNLAVNDDMIRVITEEESIKTVLGDEFNTLSDDVKGYIGDMTWSDGLREFLNNTKNEFPIFAEAACGNTGKNAALVLTGGASLMPFVEDVVKEIFPYAQIFQDKAPMSTIAKGLLYFGPSKVKSMELLGRLGFIMSHDAEGKEIDSRESALNIIASIAHDKLGLEMIRNTCANMSNLLFNEVRRWRDREIDSEVIVLNAKAKFEHWFKNAMRDEYKKSIAATKDFLAGELNKLYAELMGRLNIPGDLTKSDDFTLPYAEKLLDWWSSLYSTFEKQIEEEHEIYDVFPNPGPIAGLFGTSRDEYFNDVADALNSRNEKWVEQTFKSCKEVFDSQDAYGPFMIECLSELIDVIDKRTKEINHELILEESFDDEE